MIKKEDHLKVTENTFTQFPENIKFKFPWRKYQKRVLNELEEHLDDNHLHIIAPPGSGKTVLGLEVTLRLDKPTLIFAPTLAIRNQWIQRFCELFLQTNKVPNWISRDIKNPKFLTISTYQGLHAACSGTVETEDDIIEEELDNDKVKKSKLYKTNEIITALKAANIGTIVVDEAHHLKNAWWESLTAIKNALNPTIVGLTATPPYDVSYAEWQRYTELNGPVDAEISVPELIIEGDLCPHQDYIFFSLPTSKESQNISAYRKRIEDLFNELKADNILIEALESHPIFQNPKLQVEWIYSNLESYSATLIFLNFIGKQISESHLEIIGDKKFVIPKLNYEWMEILLTFYLYKDPVNFVQFEEHQLMLINKLKRRGAIERRAINFTHNQKVNKFLTSSSSKLDSIEKIVDFEHKQLKQDLRMVILTDYIRKEYLTQELQNDLELNKIGVMPIFEQLRRKNSRNIKIGVLTGSLIIIPIAAFEAFKKVARKYNYTDVGTTPVKFDNTYLIINQDQKLKHHIVNIITQIFQAGEIEVLVGTKSLLGEGWDAPSINSLILASFVGSYVQSNQMRGRAIRTERRNIDKTGNIWHLVCVDPSANDGGDDLQILKRRFKSFVGVSCGKELNIENGIDRLNIPVLFKSKLEIDNINNTMLANAGMREKLKQNWHEALKSGVLLIEEIKVPFPTEQNYKSIKSLYYNKTIKNLLLLLGSALTSFGYEIFQSFNKVAKHIQTNEDLVYYLMLIGGIGVLLFGGLAYKTFRLYIKYRDIAKDFHQIGEALLESLIKIGTIHTDRSKLFVKSHIDKYGSIYCHLHGGTTFEKSLFITSLQEIIGVVNNPRYVIIRKGYFLNVFSQKDYHSVPDILGRKKANAEYFERLWRNLVGSCQLVYTRTIEGRKILLKSRIHSLASEFEAKSERINKWR